MRTLLFILVLLTGCGTEGEQGRTGQPGESGRTGARGSRGIAGTDGEAGVQGETGLDGVAGVDGRNALQLISVYTRSPALSNTVFLPSDRTVAIPQTVYTYPTDQEVSLIVGDTQCDYENGQLTECLNGEQAGDILVSNSFELSMEACSVSYCYASISLYLE